MKQIRCKTLDWHGEEITDPYQVITDFFERGNVSHYRGIIRKSLIYVHKKKVYKKDGLGSLLFDFENLATLLSAAYIINGENKKGPIELTSQDVLNVNFYCGPYKHLDPWDYFPRFLSLKEYKDPYLVFRKFFRLQALENWHHDLHEILEYALSKDAEEYGWDLLKIYIYLVKLVEAAHLIDVREVTQVGGTLKNKNNH